MGVGRLRRRWGVVCRGGRLLGQALAVRVGVAAYANDTYVNRCLR